MPIRVHASCAEICNGVNAILEQSNHGTLTLFATLFHATNVHKSRTFPCAPGCESIKCNLTQMYANMSEFCCMNCSTESSLHSREWSHAANAHRFYFIQCINILSVWSVNAMCTYFMHSRAFVAIEAREISGKMNAPCVRVSEPRDILEQITLVLGFWIESKRSTRWKHTIPS